MSSLGYVSTTGNDHDQLDQMSQPTSPLTSSFPTPYASSIESQQHFSEPQHYFEKSGLPYFSDDGNGAGSSHGFGSGFSSQYTSSQNSSISTPELAAYDFDETPFYYSSPSTSHSASPYFLDKTSIYSDSNPSQLYPARHGFFESGTDPHAWQSTALKQSSQGRYYKGRRRSLSHSDVDAFTAATGTPNIRNPTFVRLQAPRTKPVIPEDRRKSRSRPKHTRSASYEPGGKGKTYAPPSPIPQFGLLPTMIGIPLDLDGNARPTHDVNAIALRAARKQGPIFEHMTSDADLARSRQIIQIGALVVRDAQTQPTTLDPSLIDPGLVSDLAAVDHSTTLLEKFADVERHFESIGSTPEVLGACTTIRKALEYGNLDSSHEFSNDSEAMEKADLTNIPSEALEFDDEDMIATHLNLEGSDLLTMLQNDMAQSNPQES